MSHGYLREQFLRKKTFFKVPVTFGTMLNFDGDGHGDVTCKQAFKQQLVSGMREHCRITNMSILLSLMSLTFGIRILFYLLLLNPNEGCGTKTRKILFPKYSLCDVIHPGLFP